MNVYDKDKEVLEDIGDVEAWCEAEYENNFGPYFEDIHKLSKDVENYRMDNDIDTIKEILTDFPIRMIEVSAILSKFQLREECMKLRIKQIESDVIKESLEKTVAAKKEEAANATIEDRILLAAYHSLIKRVEDEITFTRELIMSTKKILGYQTQLEKANPISPTDIEPYTIEIEDKKTYIKG